MVLVKLDTIIMTSASSILEGSKAISDNIGRDALVTETKKDRDPW